MNKPKILSLGFAVPEYRYTQEEVFNCLHYPHHFKAIFLKAGIQNRHFSIPLESAMHLSFQEQQEEYQKGALRLSYQAITNCLDGRDTREIGRLVYCTCTGFPPGPTIGHYLLREFKFSPYVRITNISSQGCEGGGFPGLSTAVDFTVATGKPSLVVSTELSELTYYPEPDGKPSPENDYQCLRANAIFGSASAAALVGYDDDWRHPYIVDQESYTDTKYIDDLGYTWRDGRLMVVLNKRVPEIAPLVVKPAVDTVLQRQNLQVGNIKWWIIHAAGLSVLRNIQKALGLLDEKLELSIGVLRDFGNCSSSTVGLIGKRLMSEKIEKGDYAVVITVGPGISGGATILRFGD